MRRLIDLNELFTDYKSTEATFFMVVIFFVVFLLDCIRGNCIDYGDLVLLCYYLLVESNTKCIIADF